MPEATSRLSIRTDVAFGNSAAGHGIGSFEANFVSNVNAECWSAHCTISSDAHKALRADQYVMMAVTGSNPTVDLVEDMVTPEMIIRPANPQDPSQIPYVACRFPFLGRSSNMPKEWTLRLVAKQKSSDGRGTIINFPFAVDQVKLTLVERLRPQRATMAQYTDSYSLNLRFLVICSQRRRQDAIYNARKAIDAFRAGYYKNYLDDIFIAGGGSQNDPFVVIGDEKQFDWNITDPHFGDIIGRYGGSWRQGGSRPILVLLIDNIVAMPGGLSPLGVSPLVGPHGFADALGAVFVKMANNSPSKVAHTIAHELGHYLGLTHSTSCFDWPNTANDLPQCQLYMRNPKDGDQPVGNAKLANNVMYPRGTAGRVFNDKQVRLIKNSTAVVHSCIINKTPVTRLQLTLETGGERRDAYDGAGTDNDVLLGLHVSSASGDGPQPLRWFNIDKLGAEDFEQNSIDLYVLDPGTNLFEEDICGFTIKTAIPQDTHTPPNVDQWQLKGVKIAINGRNWYDNSNINKWLTAESTDNNAFSDTLHRPTATAALVVPLDAGTAPPASVIPPFADYPIALQFTTEPVSVVRISRNEMQSLSDNKVTIQAWVKADHGDGRQVIFHAASQHVTLLLEIDDGQYVAGSSVQTDTISNCLLRVPMPPADIGKWVHISAVCDGATWTIIRNGQPLGNCAATAFAPLELPGDSCIGGSDNPSGTTSFCGQIREVAFWSVARSIDDIATDMFRVDPDTAGLIGYWPMDEGEGPICYDLSASQCDGQAFGPQWVEPIFKKPNALFFPENLTTDYVTIPSQPKLVAGFADRQITVAGWIRPVQAIVNSPYERAILANDSLVFGIMNGVYQVGTLADQPGRALCAIPAEDAGKWVKLIGVCDGENWKLYRNGALLTSAPTQVGFTPPSAASPWVIGSIPGMGGNSLQVEIRQIAVFGKAIDPITNPDAFTFLDKDGYAPPEDNQNGLLAYWPLNDGGGDQIMDQSAIDPPANGSFDPQKIQWVCA